MTAPPPVNFGEELKDGFKPVNAWVAGGIAWLDDIQSFYRERAALEKEYSTKLSLLSKRFHDKKSKKSASLTVGDTPQLTPGSLETASLTTWTTILTTTEGIAAEHELLSNALTTQVADVIKNIATRHEDYRKRHESLALKLLAERDGVYSELKKAKTAYDMECKEVEEKRQKMDKDASKGKAQRSYQSELMEMNNIKNTYLLQIEVANSHKRRYYHEDLPKIINSLQDLNETRVTKINSLWTLGSTLETACHQNAIKLLETQVSEISRNLPVLDSGMFLKHNIAVWSEPGQFGFEASPIWHDNPDMVIDEQAQVYLRNMLQKSRQVVTGLKGEVDRRGKEIAHLSSRWDELKLDENEAQKEVDVARALLFQQEDAIPHAAKLLTGQVEIEVIIATVGDLSRGAQAHSFKNTTFKLNTNCELCGERIWGLSKGLKCSDCGYPCHAKCEMKVPAVCPGVLDKAAKKALREEKKTMTKSGMASETDLSMGLTRTNTTTSVSSSLALGKGKMVRSLSTGGASALSSSSGTPVAKAPSPLSIAELPTDSRPARRILAPPPERYVPPPTIVSSSDEDDTPPSTPIPAASVSDSNLRGKLIYTFSASGENEVTADEGSIVTILEDDGAWMTVQLSNGEEGLVPSSYVEKMAPVEKKKGRGPPPPVKPRGASKSVNLHKVKALYAYNAQGDDEVTMDAGEEMVVLERDVGGWVKVRRGSLEGLVPGTYVADC